MKQKQHTQEQVKTIVADLKRRIGILVQLGMLTPRNDGKSFDRYVLFQDSLNAGTINYAMVINMAQNGDADAADLLRFNAANALRASYFGSSDEKMDRDLLDFTLLLLDGKIPPPSLRKKGRNDRDNLDRNAFLQSCVKWLVDVHGFHATRNRATADNDELKPSASACSIVVKALGDLGHHVTERHIEEVWGRRAKDRTTAASQVIEPFDWFFR